MISFFGNKLSANYEKLAYDFQFKDLDGSPLNLSEYRGKVIVVVNVASQCGFTKQYEDMQKIWDKYQEKGIAFVAISSNDVENYPQDSPDLMKQKAKEEGYTFPYLYDETQEVAKAYDAACTPDIYLFDSQLTLVYRGQLDGSRPGNDVPLTGSDLKKAIDAILEGKEVDQDQKPSLGCNIKWKNT